MSIRDCVGERDRPWFDLLVFGLVRFMSGESTGKKFDSNRSIEMKNVREADGLIWEGRLGAERPLGQNTSWRLRCQG